MGLSSKQTVTLPVPGEDGQAITIKRLSYRQLLEAQSCSEDKLAFSRVVLASAVVAWTYDAPVSDEAITDLDFETANWLVGEVSRHSVRTTDEGEGSGSDSAPPTA